ncbi:sensor histidine kinase [Paraburkholderia caribensis]|nr:sensor histidine kinase [Paraburkholderia caribensis]
MLHEHPFCKSDTALFLDTRHHLPGFEEHMSLSDFIEANREHLLTDWAEYASQICSNERALSVSELRNSGGELLNQIAADMRTAQSAAQQRAKSRGEEGHPESGFSQSAVKHADARLEQGFEINDVIAEFRALRASVLRRWENTSPDGQPAFQEMIRFNEAIDQALTESAEHYAQRRNRIQDLFAGVLAHDLRSPLNAIANSSELLLREENLSSPGIRATANIQRGTARMIRMIGDLMVFARARLHEELPVDLVHENIGRICSDAADEVRASYPHASIDVRLTGDLDGFWDGARMCQLVVNLLVNAVQHGSDQVTVEASGHGDTASISVSNTGNPIPSRAIPTLFDPLKRTRPSPGHCGTAAGMGLGLYICRSIARAHNGNIGVDSTEQRTTFKVQVPRYRNGK